MYKWVAFHICQTMDSLSSNELKEFALINFVGLWKTFPPMKYEMIKLWMKHAV